MIRSVLAGGVVALLALAGCDGLPTQPDDRALDCTQVQSHSIGSSVTGSLTRNDCQLSDGAAVDYYRVQISGSRTVRVTMTSSSIDTYVVLLDRDGYLVTEEDEGGSGFSRLTTRLSSGTYYIAATSYRRGDYGDYRLTTEYR